MTDKIAAEALSVVSKTMLATLYSHAVESRWQVHARGFSRSSLCKTRER